MGHLISQDAVARSAAAPAPSTVAAVKSLHEAIRGALGSDYDTFLQGSYKNDTSVPDLNDVDIVALRTSTYSSQFSEQSFTTTVSWESIFADVEQRLEASQHYRGKLQRGDKCVTINTAFHADVVPAVRTATHGSDPIVVYSFGKASERRNFPRVHYENGVRKQANTANTYKSMVRMYKQWARNWLPDGKVAPSFYVECLVHHAPDALFSADLAASFLDVGVYIVQRVRSTSYLASVAGDKDILVPDEWNPEVYEQFRGLLEQTLDFVRQALQATSVELATAYWRAAFRERVL